VASDGAAIAARTAERTGASVGPFAERSDHEYAARLGEQSLASSEGIINP
jgi:hypothetical protein